MKTEGSAAAAAVSSSQIDGNGNGGQGGSGGGYGRGGVWAWPHFTTLPLGDHIAYFLVHSLANSSYFILSVLYIRAISGTKGSSGLGSQSSEQMDRSTLEIVKAGLHWLLRMSKHIEPLLLIFGW